MRDATEALHPERIVTKPQQAEVEVSWRMRAPRVCEQSGLTSRQTTADEVGWATGGYASPRLLSAECSREDAIL